MILLITLFAAFTLLFAYLLTISLEAFNFLGLGISLGLTILLVVSRSSLRKAARLRQATEPEKLRALAESWQPPEELALATVPRPFRLTAAGRAGLGTSLFFMALVSAGLLLILSSAIQERRLMDQLKKNGVETRGKITSTWSRQTRGRRGSLVFFAKYEFEADGRVQAAIANYTTANMIWVKTGDLVSVLYSPGDIRISRLKMQRPEPIWFYMTLLVLLGITAFFANPAVKEAYLLRRGIPTVALVTSTRKITPRTGLFADPEKAVPRLLVECEFLDVHGRVRVAGPFVRKELIDPVTLLYDPKRPRWNIPYPSPYAEIRRD